MKCFMKNRINLTNFNIRTDLIIDNQLRNESLSTKNIHDNLKVTTVAVDEKLAKELNKKQGTYVTIEFQDVTNHEDKKEIEKVLTAEINNLLNDNYITEEDECLIIGLGNQKSTADSLGPATLENILVTRHLFELNANSKEGIRSVSAIIPGVMANTGIETYDIITSIIKKTAPKFVIVIDALASSSIDRINKTIQLTDTGIHPGSGVGNNRKEISLETIGIPVIAIGVPTVVESSILVNDTIDYIFNHLSYIKDHYDENKLVFSRGKNYKNEVKKKTLSREEKIKVSGILGSLEENEKKELICEVLNSIQYNLIVTPKEIDFLIDCLSEVISSAINHSLHREVTD